MIIGVNDLRRVNMRHSATFNGGPEFEILLASYGDRIHRGGYYHRDDLVIHVSPECKAIGDKGTIRILSEHTDDILVGCDAYSWGIDNGIVFMSIRAIYYGPERRHLLGWEFPEGVCRHCGKPGGNCGLCVARYHYNKSGFLLNDVPPFDENETAGLGSPGTVVPHKF